MSIMMDSIFGLRKQQVDPNQLIFVAKVIHRDNIQSGEDDVKDQIEDLRGEMQQLKKDLMEFTEEKLVSLAEALAEKLPGK